MEMFMRKILLASAALFLTAGMACAQTMAPPAENGTNSMETPAGGSAGKTVPNAPSGTVAAAGAPGAENGTAPVETPAGGSAGKTAPATGSTSP
jgi:hypothetical protein